MVEYDEDMEDYASEEEAWTEMSRERGHNESDEDYLERMQDLDDYAEGID